MASGIGVAVLAVGLGAPPAAQAGCPVPTTSAALAGEVEAAEARWVELDQDGFRDRLAAATATLGCLGDVPAPALVARYERVVGLAAFLSRDRERARLAFVAARRLDPSAGLPAAFAPEGNPLRADHDAIPVEVVTTEPVAPPAGTTVWIDGSAGGPRPVNVPAVVQLGGPAGTVTSTTHLWPGDPLTFPEAPPRRRLRTGWVVAALAQGAAAGGLYLGSVLTADRYWRPDTPDDRLDGLRGATNGLGAAAIAVGVTATGTAAVALAWPVPR